MDLPTPESDLLRIVQEFGASITSSLVLEETLQLIARRTAEALGADECDLYEYSPATETLTCTAMWSHDPTPADDAFIGTVVQIGRRPAYQRILGRLEVLEVHVDDADFEPEGRRLMAEWGEKSALCVPLAYRNEAIGCLVLIEHEHKRHFSDEERRVVQAIAVHAAIALHNAHMYRQQQDHARQMTSLLAGSRAITSTTVLEDVLDRVAENAIRTFGSPQCIIYEHDLFAETLVPRAFHCLPGHESPEFVEHLGQPYSLADFPTDRAILQAGEVVEERISDPSLAGDARQAMEKWDEKTCLSVPLVFRGEGLGMLILVETEHERSFTPAECDLVRAFGEQAAIALHNARLFRRREEQNRRLVTLLGASRAITGSLDAAEVVEQVTAEVVNLFDGHHATACLWLRVDDRTYVPFCGVVQPRDETPEMQSAEPDAVAAKALHKVMPVQVFDGPHSQRLVVPLALNDRPHGYLDLHTDRQWRFTDDEVQLVQVLVNQAAVALENADTYGRLEAMYLETVTALAAAMEAKDHYTAEHADLLATMAVGVGRRLGLDDEALRELQYAAVLHDIGKIGIPGGILNKPDRLTDDEFDLMTQHTVIGERIISRIEYLEPIARVIRAAHERWDGRGYPDRIAGDEIPLASRIVLVCDAYHAMTSDRPYRKALPEATALDELKANAGTQFDPAVVGVFMDVWPEFEPGQDDAAHAIVPPVWREHRSRRRPSARSS